MEDERDEDSMREGLEDGIKKGWITKTANGRYKLTPEGERRTRDETLRTPEGLGFYCAIWWNTLVDQFLQTNNLYAFAYGLFYNFSGELADPNIAPFLREMMRLFPKDEIVETEKWRISNVGSMAGVGSSEDEGDARGARE